MDDRKVLLSIKDLYVKFHVRGRVLTAIRGVSLDIYENESIAIVGESGCGKSVLTKTFAGMLDNNGFIDGGDIIFNDDSLTDVCFAVGAGAIAKAEARLLTLSRSSENSGESTEGYIVSSDQRGRSFIARV